MADGERAHYKANKTDLMKNVFLQQVADQIKVSVDSVMQVEFFVFCTKRTIETPAYEAPLDLDPVVLLADLKYNVRSPRRQALIMEKRELF